jgi:DNA-binding beta-propeller fold protein YncE
MDRRRFVLAAAGTALSLARGPAALAAWLGGTPLAYVTADLESHVVVLDLSTTRVVDRIRTGPGPRSVEAVRATIAVVAHTEYGVVSLLDSVTGRVRAELEDFAAPRYTAVHPALPYAYITDSEREEVVVVDVDRGRMLWRTAVPGPARHVSMSPDGQTLWTALGTKAARVAVLDASDPRRPRLGRTFSPPFLAHDVVFAPAGRAVWVTSGSERRLAVYREGRLRRILAAGAPPQHVAFGHDNVFVASGDDGTVRRHRHDGALLREARVPVGSYNVSFLHGRLVTPSLGAGTIALLDRDGRVRAVRTVARAAHDACIVIGP